MGVDWNLALAALLASLPISATPGPNNIICAALGARHGVRRALPYALGVTVGFPLLLASAGAGLGALLHLYPQIQTATQIAGAAFMVYLAYRIAAAPPVNVRQRRAQVGERVFGFWYAVAFQWINPKAIAHAFSVIALYTRPQAMALDVAMLMLISAAIVLPITVGWAVTGNLVSRFLDTPLRERGFNIFMGLLLLSAAVSIFFY